MNKFFTLFTAALIAVGSSGAGNASDAVDMILADAENECKSFENGVLSFNPDLAVSEVDVTGNGEMDEIVDSSAFSCSSAASLFCGTGGCSLNVIAEGVTFDFLAKAWSVRAGTDKPELAIEIHWSECDYTSFCFEKFIWNGASFDSLGANVEDPSVIMGLYDGDWTLQDYGNGKVTIVFGEDGSLSGQGPCNRYNGTHATSFPDTSFGPMAVTRRACIDGADENAYFAHLGKVSEIRLAQNRLRLIQPDGTELTYAR
ncbi:MAG: META domain-containing protein [Paracoccaceae bacterium]